MFDREDVLDHVRRPRSRASATGSNDLRDLPIVGDVRGAGYFQALEMVPDQASDARFTAEQREDLLRGFLLPRFYEEGLIARADDRGDPVVQLAPPLIAGDDELDVIADDAAHGADRGLRPFLHLTGARSRRLPRHAPAASNGA